MRKNEHKCYFGCPTDGPVHRFPKWTYPREEKFNSWKSVLEPTTLSKGNQYIYNNVRFCYRHFESFYQVSSHRLTANAIPTLNLSIFTALDDDNNISASTPTSVYPSPMPTQTEEQNTICPVASEVIDSKYRWKTGIKLVCPGYSRKLTQLRRKLLNLRKKYRSLKNLINNARKVSNLKSLLNEIEKLPEPIQIFTSLRRKYFKRPHRKTYTLKEKILSLSILKQSPKAYNLLKYLFVLPSKGALRNLLSSLVIKQGINPHILQCLKESVEKLPLEERLFSLIFDEVALDPGLSTNLETSNVADLALVVMIKSIKGKFKRPIMFMFCQSTENEEFKVILKDCIKALIGAGINIVGTVCDQASANISTIKALREETEWEYITNGHNYKSHSFEVEGNKIFPIFDPPHLLIGIRNIFLTNNIRFVERGRIKFAKWDHILSFVEKDVGDEPRLVNKINELHYIHEKIPKTEVKYAAQIFSQQLSGAIKFCTRYNILPEECGDTADFLFIIDRLFDSFNGSIDKADSKVYKTCLKNNSPHFELWNELLPILRSMRFEVKKQDGTSTYQTLPSINNFIHNIKVYKEMWMHLNKVHNITSLFTRNINREPLEIFLCKIRSNGNYKPTSDQFLNAYKDLVINDYVDTNCDDDNSLFQSLEKLLTLRRQYKCTLVLERLS